MNALQQLLEASGPPQQAIHLKILDGLDTTQPTEFHAVKFEHIDNDLGLEYYAFSVVGGRRAVAVLTRTSNVRKAC